MFGAKRRRRELAAREALRAEIKADVLAEMDFDIGDKPMDRFIDLPPWGHDLPAEFSRWHGGGGGHLKVGVDGSSRSASASSSARQPDRSANLASAIRGGVPIREDTGRRSLLKSDLLKRSVRPE